MIFKGEGRAQRIIAKRFVEKNWNEDEKMHFRRYAYPVSDELLYSGMTTLPNGHRKIIAANQTPF